MQTRLDQTDTECVVTLASVSVRLENAMIKVFLAIQKKIA